MPMFQENNTSVLHPTFQCMEGRVFCCRTMVFYTNTYIINNGRLAEMRIEMYVELWYNEYSEREVKPYVESSNKVQKYKVSEQ